MFKTKVAIIDLLRKNEEHYVFNYYTIKAIKKVFDSEIWVSKDCSYINEIDGEHVINLVEVERTKKYLWITSTVMLIRLILNIFRRKNKIVILSATPLQYLILSMLSIAVKNKIVLFMHGELGYLINPLGFGQKVGRHCIRLSMRFGTVHFICIGSPIHEIITKKFQKAKINYVHHPIVQFNEQDDNGFNNFLNFGSFGIHSEDKGSEKIYELASHLENISIITVGVSDGVFRYDLRDNVKHFCKGYLGDSLIKKTDFYRNVLRIDVALIFSNAIESSIAKYDLVSSGVFADCIAFKMPIVALRNRQLVSYFKHYGEFGILCDSIEEMACAVEKINNNPELLIMYKTTIEFIRKDFSLDAFETKMKKILCNE